MDTGLKNRVALVAASSQGIGRSIAEAFAAEGCRIAMCARQAQALHGVADAIRKDYGAEVFALPLDVTDPDAVHEFVRQTVEKFGGVDICVANAGGPPAKGFLAHMQRKNWGRIITLTSISTKQPVPDLVLSNAVRGAVVGLVKSLANEFGKDGILVNNVGPGYTATQRLNDLAKRQAGALGRSEKEIVAGWAEAAALKRIAEPREVADTVVWLASERASYITGQTILVDGGAYKGL